jgi:nicotinate-nucleotide adenylyltransferase
MKNIAIYGISANPPHIGHVFVAQYVALTGGFDEVLVIPCFSHPAGKKLIDFYHRNKMCQLAMGHIPKIVIDPIESLLPTPSYTIQTVKALMNLRPANYSFVIGSDILFNKHLWGDDLDEIFKIAPPFVIGRMGFEHKDIDCPPVVPGISSTEVRNLLCTSNSDKKLSQICPQVVIEYIKEHGLYNECLKNDNFG